MSSTNIFAIHSLVANNKNIDIIYKNKYECKQQNQKTSSGQIMPMENMLTKDI